MYASVSGQGEKFPSEQQYIPPDNDEGRWPGIRPMLVSNDKMSDRKLSLLDQALARILASILRTSLVGKSKETRASTTTAVTLGSSHSALLVEKLEREQCMQRLVGLGCSEGLGSQNMQCLHHLRIDTKSEK